MSDKQKQTPHSNYNYNSKKPSVPKTRATIHGYIANSMNGGHDKCIAWAKVMAGQDVKEYKIKKLNIKMLTPVTPTYQALKMTVRTFFVPDSRVWENSESFQAQNPSNTNKPSEYPNLGGMVLPVVGYNDTVSGLTEGITPLTQCAVWRDMFISSYIPRMGRNEAIINPNVAKDTLKFPKINVLPLRGNVAIWNDFLRNKEYQDARTEYKGDTVSAAEMQNYLPVDKDGYTMDRTKWFVGYYDEITNSGADYYQRRAKRDNSYFSDYRTDVQGFQSTSPVASLNQLVKWADWESLIAEARSQAENANLNDWEIISKIRGSKKLTEGKVQLIGQKTFNINVNAVTQTSYNNGDNVSAQFKAMGTQGAYSYTVVDVPCFAGFHFNEPGFIHVLATVTADTVYETGIDRTLLNVAWDDEYRPDLKGQKYDVLKAGEQGTTFALIQMSDTQGMVDQVIGYKRKWSELFKLPNCIGGDLTTGDWLNESEDTGLGNSATLPKWGVPLTLSKTITNNTFAYFENAANTDYTFSDTDESGKSWAGKLIYLDYTDLAINKNQAVQNKTVAADSTAGITDASNDIYIGGQNQIFFVGVAEMDTVLPVDWEIEDNATTWGEH